MKFFLLVLILSTATLVLGSQDILDGSVAFAASNATINATAKISVCGDGVKEIGEQCDSSSFGGRDCTYLGFDGGTLSCSASCEYNTSSCTTTAEQTATPIFSAGIGGSYIILDQGNSAKINLPNNFYIQDMRLQMFAFGKGTAQVSTPAPTGKYFVGKVYDFVPIDSNGNIISTLTKPATITLTYTGASVGNLDTSTFAPYYRVSGSSVWHIIYGYTINTANKEITFTTNSLNSFAIFGESTVATPPSGGGGGSTGGGNSGGGGGSMTMSPALTSTVTLSGNAYPGSIVTILKDAVVVATIHVGEDAKFSVAVGGLSGGAYLFSVYARDNKGNRSSIATIPASVVAGVAVNESGIFLAPTIDIDKSEVKKGDPIRVFGQTSPGSKVTISVHSAHPLFFQTSSNNKTGVYSYSFLTTPLEIGQHTASVRSSANGGVSRTSSSVSYIVGTRNIAKTTSAASNTFLLGDVNHDGKVNLIDFSIESFWYRKPKPPVLYDLNGDDFVNIVDFSIMASNWTG